MTKEEFKPIAEKLKLAYPQENFLADTKTLNLWLGMLQDFDARRLDRAVDRYIKRERYRPMIADLRNEYNAVLSHERQVSARATEIYAETVGAYPSADANDDETFNVWASILQNKNGIATAEIIRDKTYAFVRESELNGQVNDLPTFRQFLERISNGL